MRTQRIDFAGALEPVLTGVYSDGYVIGATSARAVVDGAALDTGDWVVGDTEAARLLLGQLGDGSGLRMLLTQAGVTIKSIASTRLDELGKVLAEGAARGDSPDQIAGAIRDLLSNKSRAHMIATTELSRAVSAATRQAYKARGITHVRWATADDDRVCPICGENEKRGAIPIDDAFPSGDHQPPAHPICRCALLPALVET